MCSKCVCIIWTDDCVFGIGGFRALLHRFTDELSAWHGTRIGVFTIFSIDTDTLTALVCADTDVDAAAD